LALRGWGVEDDDGRGVGEAAEELDGADEVVGRDAGLVRAARACEVDDGGVDGVGGGQAIGFFDGGRDVGMSGLGFEQLGELCGPMFGGVVPVARQEHVEAILGLETKLEHGLALKARERKGKWGASNRGSKGWVKNELTDCRLVG